MAAIANRGKLILRKIDRNLARLASDPNPEAVHDFRTTSRRLETLLEQMLPAGDRKHKKLLKLLNRIRRRAGRVRDIDVQLAALRSFKVPQQPRRKTQLVQRLLELRIQHERKLAKALKKRRIVELKKRIKRASQALKISTSRDPLSVAREILSSVSINGTVTEEVLHRYRIAVKRARYAAEFASESPESKQFIAGLKHLQDALGNWHDWMTLTHTARNYLGEVSQSPLVSMLHNETRIKFRHAVDALSASRKEPAAPPPLRTRKPGHEAPSSRTQAA